MKQQEAQILKWIEEDPMISQQELADRAGIARSTVSVHISNLMKKGCIAGRGYIVRNVPYVVVIGGMNVDIGGTPFNPLVAQDSNPGKVRISLGGVGRNIAHNMALLGIDVRMISALGDDLYAQKITHSCTELGIDLSASLKVPGAHTSTYLYINEADGETQLGLADMDIYEHLTPQYLSSKETLLRNAQLVLADTNIPAQSLAWLAQNCHVPLFVDPVSTAKAVKLIPILGQIHTLKPNRIEAEVLSGVQITDDESLKRCAQTLLRTGLKRVFISLGSEGVYVADQEGYHAKLPSYPAQVVSTSGCGDAFMAALAWSWLEGLPIEESAKAGLAASAITMETAEAINPEINAESICERAGIQEVFAVHCADLS